MKNDIQYLEYLFNKFYEVGATEAGGVTRLGYSKEEDQMHDILKEIGEKINLRVSCDEVGNTYISNNEGSSEHYLIGSHLDSVVNGGRYDGVAGIIAGLLILKWISEEGIKVPIKIVAFRCEESSNFGVSTIGSGLITNKITKKDIENLMSTKEELLKDVFAQKGYNLNPKKISNIKEYIELHIEQGKVLEELDIKVGIVSDIAGPRRFNVFINGQAEHSGATPMNMRNDALCAASEFILELEKNANIEKNKKSVATVGIIENSPNVLNVIPGEVRLGVDIRGIDEKSLDYIEKKMRESLLFISEKRNVEYFIQKISEVKPVKMSRSVQEKLCKFAEKLKMTYKVMPSGAGHDVMAFENICDTAMVFIPCYRGISHNKNEFTKLDSILNGAKVIYEYLKGEAI